MKGRSTTRTGSSAARGTRKKSTRRPTLSPLQSAEIPRKTVYRLSLYLRCLGMIHDGGDPIISSTALAKVAGVQPAQLRKDLAFCGPLGKRGSGYEVAFLRDRLSELLRSATLQPVVLIGVGNLGQALLSYRGFAREGFEIVAAFDLRPRAARKGKLPVRSMNQLASFVGQEGIRIAILCVPAQAAQQVGDHLVASGIQAILNFSPAVLQLPEGIAVNNVNLAIELENLGYFAR